MLDDLNVRRNSIGFLRVFFAAIVIWSHAFEIGGFSLDPISRLTGGALSAGYVAVGGFFVLSGFLITRSYETAHSPWRFLWHRVLRIFPGFWVCLLVTAFVFAPFAFFHEHGGLRGFLEGADPPWSYVAKNALLQIQQPSIGTILAHTPLTPQLLNGSLWTLVYEFVCYVSVAVLGIAGLLRRKVVSTIFLALLLAYALWTDYLGMKPITLYSGILGLLVYFSAGSCAYLIRDRIPIRGWIATVSILAIAVSMETPFSSLILALCLPYVVLYSAINLPIRNFDRRLDLSYGLYIYAFPIQQLLTIFGLNSLGFTWYFIMALTIALTFAAASWIVIERPSMSLKNLRLG